MARERAERGIRHQFVAGEFVAMVGARENRNTFVSNIIHVLVSQMMGHPCLTFANDMRVRIEAADASSYPDVLALCAEQRFHHGRRDVLLNPILAVEALSVSTEAYVREDKLAIYRRLQRLREYLLVSQNRAGAEFFSGKTNAAAMRQSVC